MFRKKWKHIEEEHPHYYKTVIATDGLNEIKVFLLYDIIDLIGTIFWSDDNGNMYDIEKYNKWHYI